jgi:hypothetical protein
MALVAGVAEQIRMTEDLTPDNLHKYLWYVILATQVQNDKTDLGKANEDERAQYAMRQGAAMLAQEIIDRYELGPRPEDN